MDTLGPAKNVQIILIFMIMYHLGPQLGVWIMQVSTFSSALINRFHCITVYSGTFNFGPGLVLSTDELVFPGGLCSQCRC